MKVIIILLLLIISLVKVEISMGKDELVYGESEEPTTLNPLNMTDAVSHRFYKLLYNTLISTDINMMPIPELLESLKPISISEDGTGYIFKLKEGVKWHDGKELTAEDIVFTVNIIKSPKTDSNVKVVHEFSQVKAIDKYKLEIRTKWKLPKERLLGLLTFPVIPKHIFHENKEYITANDEFGRATIIGSGPYRFKRWIPLRAVQLDRYPEYFEKFEELPKKNSSRINKITMQYVKDEVIMKDMLVMGRLDLIPVIRPVDYDEIRKDPFCDLIKYNSKKFAYFAYNCNSEFFKDKRVRLAISYALDRKAMLKTIYGEYVDESYLLSGPYPPGEAPGEVFPLEYNIDKAQALLKAAGWEDKDGDGILEKEGVKFIVSLKAYVKDEDLRRIVTLYQSALSKLKIMLKKNKVDFIPLEKWQEEVIKNKDFEIAFGIFSFSPDTDIPYTLFSQDALLTGYNFVGYRNELVDKLLWENRITFDPDVIRENKKKIQQIIRDDSPYTFLFILPAYTGIRKNVLKGVDIHPFHFFAFIKHWYLEEGF